MYGQYGNCDFDSNGGEYQQMAEYQYEEYSSNSETLSFPGALSTSKKKKFVPLHLRTRRKHTVGPIMKPLFSNGDSREDDCERQNIDASPLENTKEDILKDGIKRVCFVENPIESPAESKTNRKFSHSIEPTRWSPENEGNDARDHNPIEDLFPSQRLDNSFHRSAMSLENLSINEMMGPPRPLYDITNHRNAEDILKTPKSIFQNEENFDFMQNRNKENYRNLMEPQFVAQNPNSTPAESSNSIIRNNTFPECSKIIYETPAKVYCSVDKHKNNKVKVCYSVKEQVIKLQQISTVMSSKNEEVSGIGAAQGAKGSETSRFKQKLMGLQTPLIQRKNLDILSVRKDASNEKSDSQADNGSETPEPSGPDYRHKASDKQNESGQSSDSSLLKHGEQSFHEFDSTLKEKVNLQRKENTLTINRKKYVVQCIIGCGGSSKVFQVLEPKTSQVLAVKRVDLSIADGAVAQGYLNEISLLRKLQGSETVIKMHDYEYVPEKQVLYVAMEKGEIDLSKLIKDITKTKQIPMTTVVHYWTEMLRAVQNIHDNGVIHSDLKPANFLLVCGKLKLIDFGIASSVQSDMTSVVKDCPAGTYNYISPEAVQTTCYNGSSQVIKISYKSDIWSLGCILYNLLYGKTPFQHIIQIWAKLAAITNKDYLIEYPEIGNKCPPVLLKAVKQCLTYDPKKRPTAKQLLELPYLNYNNV